MNNQIKKALDAYVKILKKENEIIEEHKNTLSKLEKDKEKIEEYLMKFEDIEDVPDEIKSKSPFLAWKISPKTDESVTETYMQIDRVLIPKMEKRTKELVANLKEQCNQLKAWALNELLKRKSSNFSVKGIGRAEKRVDVKYNINDKPLLINWAVEEGTEDELTITFRPNNKFLAKVVEDTGELPPGISSYRESKVVFVKA